MKLRYIFFSVVLFSCSSSNMDFINISEFMFKTNALKDNEMVEIMYCSGEPGNNTELNYYLHYIVISQVTGDTVNVLSTMLTDGISAENRIFSFCDENSMMTKALQNIDVMARQSNRSIHPDELTTKRLDRVVINSKLTWSGKNNYPTVIGVLATQTKPPRDTTTIE